MVGRSGRAALAVVVAAILLFLVLRKVSLATVLGTVAHASLPLVLAGAGAAFLYVVLRAARFRLLLGRGPLGRTLAVTASAWGAGLVLPGPGGDATFIWLARRDLEAPVARATGAALVARLLDLMTLILILLVSADVARVHLPAPVRASALGLGGVFLLALLVLFWQHPRRIVLAWAERLPLVGRFALRAEQVLDELSSGRAMAWLVLSTVGARVLTALQYLALFLALGTHISFWQVWFALAVRTLLFALPVQGIGGLGTSQLWWTGALTLAGWPLPAALAISLEVQILDLAVALPQALVGWIALVAGRSRRARREAAALEPAALGTVPDATAALTAVAIAARWGGRAGTLAARAWRALCPPGSGPWLLVPVALFVALRIPSMFEPHWYTDEAGYATTAWLSTHGGILYRTVWNNKPPLLFWTYGAVLALFGPSEFGLHLMSMLWELLALLALWRLACNLVGYRRAAVAVLLAAVALGSPIVNGDLALPENLLIGPATCGILAVLTLARRRVGRTDLALGALAGAWFAVAILYQQTALADLGAAAIWLALLPDRRGWRALTAMLGVCVAIVGLAIAPYLVWAGPGNVWYFLVASYVGYARHGISPSLGIILPRALAMGAFFAGAVLGRRDRGAEWRLIWLWLAATVITAILPNRAYVFFTVPMVVPLALLLSAAPIPHPSRWLSGAADLIPSRGAVVVAAMIPLTVWGGMLVSHGPLSTYTVRLTSAYYPNFVKYMAGDLSSTAYSNTFNYRATSEAEAVAWLGAHHLSGVRAVVWSSDAWPYLLGELHPVLPTPALYVDELWLGPQGVMRRVRSGAPLVVITTESSLAEYPQIIPYLRQEFVHVYTAGYAGVWIRRGDEPRGAPPPTTVAGTGSPHMRSATKQGVAR